MTVRKNGKIADAVIEVIEGGADAVEACMEHPCHLGFGDGPDGSDTFVFNDGSAIYVSDTECGLLLDSDSGDSDLADADVPERPTPELAENE